MRIAHCRDRRPQATDAAIADLLRCVSSARLRGLVEMLAFPRHYEAEKEANVGARDHLLRLLRSFGYKPILQGTYDNVVAASSEAENGPCLLLGAHYDSKPGTPGADDNGSALAICLECARLLGEYRAASTMIIFFNREEDGLLGSSEFVAHLASQSKWVIEEAQIFEMVGYCSRAARSQRTPPRLPVVSAPDTGDFLALPANRQSNAIAETLLTLAVSYVAQLPVLALKICLGIERYFGYLHRSDHAPFWKGGIPAIMWTDTAEFRNPNYHLASDTPDTLDYDFISRVTKLALVHALARFRNLEARGTQGRQA
jgi:hypothetical protein